MANFRYIDEFLSKTRPSFTNREKNLVKNKVEDLLLATGNQSSEVDDRVIREIIHDSFPEKIVRPRQSTFDDDSISGIQDYFLKNDEDMENSLHRNNYKDEEFGDAWLEAFGNDEDKALLSKEISSSESVPDAIKYAYFEDNYPGEYDNIINSKHLDDLSSENDDEYLNDLYNQYMDKELLDNQHIAENTSDVTSLKPQYDKVNVYHDEILRLLNRNEPNRDKIYNNLANYLREKNYSDPRRRYYQINNWLDRSNAKLDNILGKDNRSRGYKGSEQDFNRMMKTDEGYNLENDRPNGIEHREVREKPVDWDLIHEYYEKEDPNIAKQLYGFMYGNKDFSKEKIEEVLNALLDAKEKL